MSDPPFPPDESANRCNGRTNAGTACRLEYNWGRDDPTQNPGRCRYHRDQTVQSDPTPTDPEFDVPGTLDAAAFDSHDGADIEDASLGGSGQGSIGYVEEGEWTEYQFSAPAGTYRVALAVASDRDGRLRVDVDGEEVGTVEADTEGWYNFQEIAAGDVTLSEGAHTLRITSVGLPLNYDAISFTAVSDTGEETDTGTWPAYGEGLYGELLAAD